MAKFVPSTLYRSLVLFFCLSLLVFPFNFPCRMIFAKSEDLELWPNPLNFFTMIRSLLYSPMAAWIFLQTFSFMAYSPFAKYLVTCKSILSQMPSFISLNMLPMSTTYRYRNMERTRKLFFSTTFGLRDILFSRQICLMDFNLSIWYFKCNFLLKKRRGPFLKLI